MTPKVTFIVPCYRLAHLLGECLQSILNQSFQDFEILVMDDCSPDNTREVAQTFGDSRLRYVRNEVNLGHLRNYNKGIGLAQGDYIWLISADDLLYGDDALAKYVEVLNSSDGIAYVFSPTIELRNGIHIAALYSGQPETTTTIYRRSEFYRRLIWASTVHAGATMARRRCFEEAGRFPVDLPYAGDFYHWCYMSMRHCVGYVPQPTNLYRKHDRNITDELARQGRDILINDNVTVRWRMLAQTRVLKRRDLEMITLKAIANDYAIRIRRWESESWVHGLSMDEFERSVKGQAENQRDLQRVRGLTFCYLADFAAHGQHWQEAEDWYRAAVAISAWNWRWWAKRAAAKARSFVTSR